MHWIEIVTWIALALAMAMIPITTSRRQIRRPGSVVASAVITALLGGFAVRALHIPPLRIGDFSISALVVAAAIAALDVWLGMRDHAPR